MKIRPAFQPLLAFVALMTGISLLLTACAWSVPADPGLNSRLRDREPPPDVVQEPGIAPASRDAVATDPRARALYMDHCTRCHEPIAPASIPAADWPRYVRRYGPRSGLFGADRAQVLRWLQANAH
ncbi:MAG: hypothetical protein QNJ90_02120 [Planctomycetota bacterium]|nr:hypothetical protein [Planctomycetota bacterium]